MHSLEGHDLGRGDIMLTEQLLQVNRVVVAEDVLGAAGVDNAVYHGGVVTLVREDLAVCTHTEGQLLSQWPEMADIFFQSNQQMHAALMFAFKSICIYNKYINI